MSKISDMLISALLKKGIMMESKTIEAEATIPDSGITIKVKADNVSVTLIKE